MKKICNDSGLQTSDRHTGLHPHCVCSSEQLGKVRSNTFEKG